MRLAVYLAALMIAQFLTALGLLRYHDNATAAGFFAAELLAITISLAYRLHKWRA